MVIVKIIGGLGNQMFQYSLIKAFEEAGVKVKADYSDYGKSGLTLHNGFELDRLFGVKPEEATKAELARVRNGGSLPYYMRRALNRAFGKSLPHYREGLFDSSIIKDHWAKWNNKKAYFDGYWQSREYFAPVEGVVKKAFAFPDFTTERNRELAEAIAVPNSVAVHVRGGDYLSTPELFELYGCVCNKDYYSKAIDMIREKVENPRFFVFSNDFAWVEKNLELNENETVFVKGNEGADSFRDMQLMTKCRHRIMANSSFSWWGAFLAEKPGVTLVPARWTGKDEQKEIYLENWIKISN